MPSGLSGPGGTKVGRSGLRASMFAVGRQSGSGRFSTTLVRPRRVISSVSGTEVG